MDREPPEGARRRWKAAELVPEQPGERCRQDFCRFQVAQDGFSPLQEKRFVKNSRPMSAHSTCVNQSGTAQR